MPTPPPRSAASPSKVAAVVPRTPDTRPVVATKPAAAATAGPAIGPGEPLARVLQAQMLMGNAAVAASLLGAPREGIPPGGTVGVPLPVSRPSAAVVPGGRPATVPPTPRAPVAAPAEDSLKQAADPAALAPSAPAPAKAEAPPPTEGGGGGARPTADQHPKFGVLKRDVSTKKRRIATSHPPARAESVSAQSAAVPPRDDKEAQGKVANADRMNEAKPKSFDKRAFVDAVKKAVADKAPKTLEDAEAFPDSDQPQQIKQDVQHRVDEGRTEAAEEIKTTTDAPPDTSGAVEKKVVPMVPDRPPGVPGTPDPANATPDRLPPAATDLSAGPREVDREMAGAQVTETQLARSNEPSFQGAVKAKKGLEKDSAESTPAMRVHEAEVLGATTAGARAVAAAGMKGLAGARVAAGRAVGAGKQGAKTTDEQKRAQVTATLQAVFDATRKDVGTILTGLDRLVDDQFNREEKAARTAFTAEHRRAMAEYKRRRYSAWNGTYLWLKDKAFDLPDEANQIIDEARRHYVERMETVISNIADTIGGELTRAKDRITRGRADLQAEVRRLPADLRAIGREAAADFADRFDELDTAVDEKSGELVQTLATKYNEALKSVDDEVAAEKEKNKGALTKAMDAVKGVIKTIIDLKNLLLGVLAKAASAVMLILKDPIGFLRNLVGSVGAGLKQFLKNIVGHLQQGMISWLLGVSAQAGLQLPKSFDVRSIMLLLATLLGLTWGFIRSRIVRKVPEKAVAAVESGIDLVQKVRKGGVGALWDEIKSRIGDLKKTLIDKVIEYLVPTIIVAGITWVLSLLNPASAFIRACKLIIDIVRFVVERGRQILDFVNAVLDAVIAIARGGSGGVPGMIENALVRAIPVLIGFLAALLGVGGIAAKVKKIFEALSKPVAKAIDWVVDKIVTLAKKLWAKIQAKLAAARRKATQLRDKVRDKVREKFDRSRRPDQKKRQGDRSADAGGAGLKPEWETVSFSAAGESHRLWIEVTGGRPGLMVASTTAAVTSYLADVVKQNPEPALMARVSSAQKIVAMADADALDIVRSAATAQVTDAGVRAKLRAKHRALVGEMRELAGHLAAIFAFRQPIAPHIGKKIDPIPEAPLGYAFWQDKGAFEYGVDYDYKEIKRLPGFAAMGETFPLVHVDKNDLIATGSGLLRAENEVVRTYQDEIDKVQKAHGPLRGNPSEPVSQINGSPLPAYRIGRRKQMESIIRVIRSTPRTGEQLVAVEEALGHGKGSTRPDYGVRGAAGTEIMIEYKYWAAAPDPATLAKRLTSLRAQLRGHITGGVAKFGGKNVTIVLRLEWQIFDRITQPERGRYLAVMRNVRNFAATQNVIFETRLK
ncbi:hypothetical protein [Actinoplanes sp. NBRC 101535]|uniref:hypothetical protein n=1 Tax=Actinoplanes sp. NBRC 101535 TaxID=3032196 RepID=UPI0024A340FB|nr:hypothetical protein [Actinoplanes sp. NBRC 101535]GLY05344.1 hypothetical protein Acsp01_57230 [Actinoplanes sp. NBRC 101535]